MNRRDRDSQTASPPDSAYGDPSSKVWSFYLGVADGIDKDLAESLKGDMDGILIFTGLFSASVSAFLIESYRALQQDPATVTVQLLAQISQQLSGDSTSSQPPSSSTPFRPSNSTVRVNVFWFLSLVLSVSCALGAILVQQWARRYLRMTQRPSAPYRRARIRSYLFNGVERFQLHTVAEGIPVLLHASVFLFFAGLVQFLLTINNIVAYCVLSSVALASCAYILVTILPILTVDSPYLTPLSAPLWFLLQALLLPIMDSLYHLTRALSLFSSWQTIFSVIADECRGRMSDGLTRGLLYKAYLDQDFRALSWITRSVYDDIELMPFIEGIPGFLKSARIKSPTETLERLFTEQWLGRRISAILLLCTDASSGLSATRTHRALSCMHAVWAVTDAFRRDGIPYSHLDTGRRIMFALKLLRADRDPAVALAAHCTAMLRAPLLLSDAHRHVYRALEQVDDILTWMPTALKEACPAREDMLRDGPLAALTHLVESAQPLLGGVPEGGLAVLWDTVHILAKDVVARPHASPVAQARFVVVLRDTVGRRKAERVPVWGQVAYHSEQPPYARLARILFGIAQHLTDEACLADVAELEEGGHGADDGGTDLETSSAVESPGAVFALSAYAPGAGQP